MINPSNIDDLIPTGRKLNNFDDEYVFLNFNKQKTKLFKYSFVSVDSINKTPGTFLTYCDSKKDLVDTLIHYDFFVEILKNMPQFIMPKIKNIGLILSCCKYYILYDYYEVLSQMKLKICTDIRKYDRRVLDLKKQLHFEIFGNTNLSRPRPARVIICEKCQDNVDNKEIYFIIKYFKKNLINNIQK